MSCSNDIDTAIRAAGLRRTLPRSLVLTTLRHEAGHRTPGEVFEVLSADHPEARIARSTVYRTLETLEARGLVSAVRTGGSETRYEWSAGDHHHLVCRSCGGVVEVELSSLASLGAEVEAQTQFRPEFHHLTIHGLCQSCAKSAERATGAEAADSTEDAS